MTSSAPAVAFLANGKVGSDGLRPHDDLLAEFLFLGWPSPVSLVSAIAHRNGRGRP